MCQSPHILRKRRGLRMPFALTQQPWLPKPQRVESVPAISQQQGSAFSETSFRTTASLRSPAPPRSEASPITTPQNLLRMQNLSSQAADLANHPVSSINGAGKKTVSQAAVHVASGLSLQEFAPTSSRQSNNAKQPENPESSMPQDNTILQQETAAQNSVMAAFEKQLRQATARRAALEEETARRSEEAAQLRRNQEEKQRAAKAAAKAAQATNSAQDPTPKATQTSHPATLEDVDVIRKSLVAQLKPIMQTLSKQQQEKLREINQRLKGNAKTKPPSTLEEARALLAQLKEVAAQVLPPQPSPQKEAAPPPSTSPLPASPVHPQKPLKDPLSSAQVAGTSSTPVASSPQTLAEIEVARKSLVARLKPCMDSLSPNKQTEVREINKRLKLAAEKGMCLSLIQRIVTRESVRVMWLRTVPQATMQYCRKQLSYIGVFTTLFNSLQPQYHPQAIQGPMQPQHHPFRPEDQEQVHQINQVLHMQAIYLSSCKPLLNAQPQDCHAKTPAQRKTYFEQMIAPLCNARFQTFESCQELRDFRKCFRGHFNKLSNTLPEDKVVKANFLQRDADTDVVVSAALLLRLIYDAVEHKTSLAAFMVAALYKELPALSGVYPTPDMNPTELRAVLGLKENQRTEDFVDKIDNIVRVVVALVEAFASSTTKIFSAADVWRMLAQASNSDADVLVASTLMSSTIELYGYRLQVLYGPQFDKLKSCIGNQCLPQMASTPATQSVRSQIEALKRHLKGTHKQTPRTHRLDLSGVGRIHLSQIIS
ncbi:uncharacterized protein MONBRDRAFT_29456 [Monosiga brevicollis MX1]|uniref:Uncharacterized protein n=1 Tax=Monosiga brevicollis TaxID=81824 RepID=A9VB56_MONBE|nr:uncharacterized protein MONBRDRAFT_29456 [Monosiga brevicollis MX1]EDQ85281.1 predicted protein [Monosiga brevicollis MX1]|eukprot:XP_001749902.1 hypothetical protein [Monosiga brevicollis MX1]